MADLTFVKPLLKKRGIKIKDFCKEIGVTQQGFAKIIRYNSTKIDTLELIAAKLNIPVADFFKDNVVNTVINSNYMNVPFVPAHVQEEYSKMCGDKVYIKKLPTVPVSVDNAFKGNYRVFEVKGDSMYDSSIRSLLNGDKILCREVSGEFLCSPLRMKDWYFVIVYRKDSIHSEDGIMVKQIVAHDEKRGVITCHSLNQLFKDFEMNLDSVVEFYNVVSIVERDMRI
jgi:DNA-binding Xre family transcriptional regulator